jgi:hypothetical protein
MGIKVNLLPDPDQLERDRRHAERDDQIARIEARLAADPAASKRFDQMAQGLIRSERYRERAEEFTYIGGFEEDWTLS